MADIVSFFAHGRAFAIHKPRRFVSDIMPKFFRQTRLTSFQRQLNLYGFRRISQGPDNGGYYHELFLKGRPRLCVNMKRTKVKGTSKLKRDPETEPNFYAMRPVGVAGSQNNAPPAGPQAPMPTQQQPGYPFVQAATAVAPIPGFPYAPGSYGVVHGSSAACYATYQYPPFYGWAAPGAGAAPPQSLTVVATNTEPSATSTPAQVDVQANDPSPAPPAVPQKVTTKEQPQESSGDQTPKVENAPDPQGNSTNFGASNNAPLAEV